MLTLRRSRDVRLVRQLHDETFPEDSWEDADAYWVARESGRPVGFCSVRHCFGEPSAFLTRAGVLPAGRGKGLQRRMIDVRCRWAKQEGVEYVITYTTRDNYPSITNLLRSGFRFYEPAVPWAGPDVFYFQRRL